MSLSSVKIGDKEFRVKVIHSTEEMKQGLSGAPELGKGKGLYFLINDEPWPVRMNMGGMNHAIDMIFISNGMVKEVKGMKVSDPEVSVNSVEHVLEVRSGEGEGLEGKKVVFEDPKVIKKETANVIVNVDKLRAGGRFRAYEEEVKAKKGSMQVLDDTGKILMNIKGGERIFSIKHTNAMVELAKKIDIGEAEPEELGKMMEKIIHKQNTQAPEYV
jgi:uncharacterized membrane protein (UPF0127 family)